MLDKKDAVSDVPSHRWEPYYKRDPRNPELLKKVTTKGSFLDNLENFDAGFFGISPREAELMDPQQRICLEVAWEALEHAGISPNDIAGSDAAVLMGVNSDDYGRLMLEDLPGIEAWMGVGSSFCGVPNRISYLLDLHGNSIALDAACASSLIAIHHAKQLLENYESEVAVVGGVNAMCGPGLIRVLDVAGATSPEGRCRSFDAEAKGYGRGEGAAVVIMKRVEDAIRDGDQILSVVKGTAVGQDGRTNGIMQPNPQAQAEVYKKALSAAGFDASTVDFVEAHATSTRVGDPKEVSAITSIYGSAAGRTAENPCYIGSVKPNVGHLEAGAGVAGVIKATLALHYRQLPPQANLQTLNPAVDWANSGLEVVRDARPWPRPDQTLRAGVCSYGYGGSISHLVLEEAPSREALKKEENNGPVILTLSGPGEKWYKGQAAKLAEWLKTDGAKIPLSAIATTLSTRRAHHHVRASIVAENHEGAIASLEKLSKGIDDPTIIKARTVSGNTKNDVVWIFSGHGAQYPSMGVELLKTEPEFAKVIDTLEPVYQETLGFSPRQALETGNFETTDKIQALTFAMHVGLAAVLKSRGIKPAAIIGHSVGEIAAAVTTGALTLLEGARVASIRASLYGRPDVAGKGAMILVDIPFEDVEKDCASRKDINASIHASPTSTVVSGTPEAIKEYSDYLATQQQQVRVVKSDVAFHSPLLTFLGPALTGLLGDTISPKQADIKLYSTSDLDARTEKLRNCEYWINNMLGPVWLTSAVKAAAEDGYKVFLEVSAHPLVSHSINETLMEIGEDESVVIPTIRRNHPAWEGINTALGRLHANGAVVDFKKFVGKTWVPSLPLTVWQHEKYWHEVTVGTPTASAAERHDVNAHVLLGAKTQVSGVNDTSVWQTVVDETCKPFPLSHPLHGTEIAPAAVLINTFIHAAECISVYDVVLRFPVPISSASPREVQVVYQEKKALKIRSRLVATENKGDELSWMTHTTAKVPANPIELEEEYFPIDDIYARCTLKRHANWAIDYLSDIGVAAMGFPWTVENHVEGNREFIAKVNALPDGSTDLPWDPTSWACILDAATSIGSAVFYRSPILRMPAHIDSITIAAPPPPSALIYVREVPGQDWTADVVITALDGKVLAKLRGMRFSQLDGTPGVSGSVESLAHNLHWTAAQLETTSAPLNNVVFVADKAHSLLGPFKKTLTKRGLGVKVIESPSELESHSDILHKTGTVVIVLPDELEDIERLPQTNFANTLKLLETTKRLNTFNSSAKLWVITEEVQNAKSEYSLAAASMLGLARIIASEQPDLWGGLIDIDEPAFPFQVLKFIHKADVVTVRDGVSKIARLRALPKASLTPGSDLKSAIKIRPDGTYLITGGLGALGLEVASWLAEKGARRLVLLSRKGLPLRSTWSSVTSGPNADIINKVKTIEALGVAVNTVSLDLGKPGASEDLKKALDNLSLPPVTGVVHAAGIMEDALIHEATEQSFKNALTPKVDGSWALHNAFPVGTLDFLVLFSSCGQLFGFPGQGAYASGNAFLDALASYRRNAGDNALSLLWTAWNGLGMSASASADFIDAEMESKGITGVTRDEAFRAWEYAAKYDVPQVVVVRSLPIDEGATPAVPILTDIAARRPPPEVDSESEEEDSEDEEESAPAAAAPSNPADLKKHLEATIKADVASVLRLSSPDDVDTHRPLSELGMDSVMTVGLRKQFKDTFKVTIPPTLIWAHPTVAHLTKWFAENAKVSAPSAAATSSAPKKSKSPKKSAPSSSGSALPSNPADLKKHLEQMIKADVASVLRLSSPDDVDTHRPLSELGMDSVMTVGLRKQFKDTFKVTIPPTLIWAHPTVAHLTKWFTENAKPTTTTTSAAPTASSTKKSKSTKKSSTSSTGLSLPTNPAELKKHLEKQIKADVASVLRLSSPDDVDPHRPLSELGMDSVMTVGLRKQFKDTFKVQIPPTLIWAHPTVSHLCKWFAENLAK